MRIAFMGTPEFSVPVLSELVASGHEVVAVYTQPPRPAGRGKKLRASPVQQMAEQYAIEVRSPDDFKAQADRDAFFELNLDVAIVVAYGLILPRAILEAPHYGCLNLHASLLPRWRGAAPIHRAIMAGDSETGVQVMQMEAGLDTGDILLSETLPITPEDTMSKLHDSLSSVGAQLAPRALAALERGSLVATAQSGEGITYAHKITTAEAQINWQKNTTEVDCHIRGLSSFPGAWFLAGDKDGNVLRIKALFSSVVAKPLKPSTPGTIINATDHLVIACANGAIKLHQVQRPGKAPQSAADFLRGLQLETGTILESAVQDS